MATLLIFNRFYIVFEACSKHDFNPFQGFQNDGFLQVTKCNKNQWKVAKNLQNWLQTSRTSSYSTGFIMFLEFLPTHDLDRFRRTPGTWISVDYGNRSKTLKLMVSGQVCFREASPGSQVIDFASVCYSVCGTLKSFINWSFHTSHPQCWHLL